MARILVIDDEEDFRFILREFLEREGHHVVEAADGGTGLELFCAHHFDLVITDIIMPFLGGYKVIQYLNEHHPNVPVIGVSGGGGTYNPAFCLDLAARFGARYVLGKPVSRSRLLRAVAECLVCGSERDSIAVQPPL